MSGSTPKIKMSLILRKNVQQISQPGIQLEVPVNAKKYRGNQRQTLPVILHYDIAEGNSQHAGNETV